MRGPRLDQNLNIIAANILPISSLCSRHIRPISQALNEAASAREIRDTTASMISKRSQRSRAEERRRSDGSTSSNTTAEGRAQQQQRASSESSSSVNNSTASVREALTVDAWPLGIIKTVSVEVVEEDVADLVQDRRRASGDRGVSRQEQNWG